MDAVSDLLFYTFNLNELCGSGQNSSSKVMCYEQLHRCRRKREGYLCIEKKPVLPLLVYIVWSTLKFSLRGIFGCFVF